MLDLTIICIMKTTTHSTIPPIAMILRCFFVFFLTQRTHQGGYRKKKCGLFLRGRALTNSGSLLEYLYYYGSLAKTTNLGSLKRAHNPNPWNALGLYHTLMPRKCSCETGSLTDYASQSAFDTGVKKRAIAYVKIFARKPPFTCIAPSTPIVQHIECRIFCSRCLHCNILPSFIEHNYKHRYFKEVSAFCHLPLWSAGSVRLLSFGCSSI